MYSFIHPTKSGGTVCIMYVYTYYKQYFLPCSHKALCTNTNNPIIIVRDVLSRFFSMFKYWKYGGDYTFRRSKEFIEMNKDVTIIDFITLLKEKAVDKLYQDFTWEDHFRSTSYWINNTDYKNIIIIKYDSDLNFKIQSLLDKLSIPNRAIKQLPHVNTSLLQNEDLSFFLDNMEYVNSFVNVYFQDDVKLISTIDNHPELFKLVI